MKKCLLLQFVLADLKKLEVAVHRKQQNRTFSAVQVPWGNLYPDTLDLASRPREFP